MDKAIKISRSGLKLFLECPRCFWLDLHHKIKRPPSFPYTLASAVDFLVKQEFDKYRVQGTLPPAFKKYFEANPAVSGARLYAGEDLETWRNNFKGISYFDEDLNAMLYGAVDDVLQFTDGSLSVIDYKSTGSREITIYDDYQKQMDTYSYILQRMGFKTQPSAYFVYYIVDKTGGGFANALPFREEVRQISVDPSWVGPAFERAVHMARQPKAPAPGGRNGEPCVHCAYVQRAGEHTSPILHGTDSDKDYVVIEE